MRARGGVASPYNRAWLSYLADLSLAEDDHDWQALPQWKTPDQARGSTRCAFARPHQQVLTGRDPDPAPLLGWACWDHAQQSLALSLVVGA